MFQTIKPSVNNKRDNVLFVTNNVNRFIFVQNEHVLDLNNKRVNADLLNVQEVFVVEADGPA